MAKIQSIYRYPIKGLTPERLPRTVLTRGQTVPGDRLYAIENGPSGFDPAAPKYLSKTHFLMLVKNERLAAVHAAFDQASHVLTLTYERRVAAAGDLRTAEGRAAIERFFAEYCADELRGPPKVLHADDKGFSFSDVAKRVVSIINLASVAALEDMTGAAVNPLRFRGNLYVSGWPAWSELERVGQELMIADARLKVVKRTVRCPATNVDPDTALRDLEIPRTLMNNLGHADCGIYAEVVEGGAIAENDDIVIAA
jgi:uncharacterized protein YcbX